MSQPALVIFDLAGTTLEDHGEVPAAFTAALAEHGLPITDRMLRNVRGASKRQALWDLVPAGPGQAERVEAVYATFREYLQQGYADRGVRPVAGAVSTFEAFRAQGVRVALTTGFDREVTRYLLEALGWHRGHVEAVVCGDEVSQGRLAPYLIFRAMEATGTTSVHRVATVGDTTRDLLAGYHAGVRWNIGVLTGAHDRALLEPMPHTHLVASVADLPGLLGGGPATTDLL
jgi:phosphonatase-like hydrolase